MDYLVDPPRTLAVSPCAMIVVEKETSFIIELDLLGKAERRSFGTGSLIAGGSPQTLHSGIVNHQAKQNELYVVQIL